MTESKEQKDEDIRTKEAENTPLIFIDGKPETGTSPETPKPATKAKEAQIMIEDLVEVEVPREKGGISRGQPLMGFTRVSDPQISKIVVGDMDEIESQADFGMGSNIGKVDGGPRSKLGQMMNKSGTSFKHDGPVKPQPNLVEMAAQVTAAPQDLSDQEGIQSSRNDSNELRMNNPMDDSSEIRNKNSKASHEPDPTSSGSTVKLPSQTSDFLVSFKSTSIMSTLVNSSTIATAITCKLTRTNFLLWKAQVVL
ncbi:hypothetical protein L6452_07974 [Arctium lappa]|uniref:Uncharacterized protein n=1 Tax=Arctium lappa TaxID=4217 RepID=A0ACB9DG04_ARCLA|nr:hypothetical protein L6452_07974 [Arctium lappa]